MKSHSRCLNAAWFAWISAAIAIGPHCLAGAQTAPAGNESNQAQTSQPILATGSDAATTRQSDRRRAAKLYLNANKQFMAEQFEDALKSYDEAAKLDPGNRNYRLATQVARNHAVTALIQSAAKDRLRGDADGARKTLARAIALDPTNIEATQHLYELGDDAARQLPVTIDTQGSPAIGDSVVLKSSPELH